MRIGWVPDGETVVIAGREIPGMIHICDTGQRNHIHIENSSSPIWIDVSKPVGERYRKGAPLGGSSYNTMRPESRAGYLDWLAGGKTDIQVHPDFLKLNFYGLEHRLLQADPSTDEMLELMEELERLNTIYSRIGKFRKVCNQFVKLLDYARIAFGLTDRDIQNTHEFLDLPLELTIDISNTIRDGRALTGEQLLQWLEHDYMGVDSMTQSPGDLEAEFIEKFEKTYPNGIIVDPPDRNLTVKYESMSGEFTVSKVVTHNHRPVLDVCRLDEPLDVALAVFDVMTRFPGFWHFGENLMPSQHTDDAKNRNLESDGRGSRDVQTSPEFAEWAEDLIQRGISTTFGDLVRTMGRRRPGSPNFQLWEGILDDLECIGIGVAPNSLFQMHYVAWEDPIFLYKSEAKHKWGYNTHFYAALVRLSIGAYVYSAAEASEELLKDRLRSFVSKCETDENLNKFDIAGLQANAEYLIENPPSDELIRELKVASNQDFLETMRLAVVEFSTDSELPRHRGVSIAQNVYRIFDLDPKKAEEDMQAH